MKKRNFLEPLMNDDNRLLAIIGACILLFGSYFRAYSVSGGGQTDEHSFFEGMFLGGLFAKLMVVGAVAVIVMIIFGGIRYVWRVALFTLGTGVIQLILIFTLGWTYYGKDVKSSVTPGLGLIFVIAGMVMMLVFAGKLQKGLTENKGKEKENL